MKSKQEILESYFGSDYWLLKQRDDLQYILRAMDEYANQFTSQVQSQPQKIQEVQPLKDG